MTAPSSLRSRPPGGSSGRLGAARRWPEDAAGQCSIASGWTAGIENSRPMTVRA